MTEKQLRDKVVDIMRGWLGSVRGDTKHKEILAVYNGNRPLPRGHKMSESEHYCATTASAAFIKAGLAGITVLECSASKMVELAKAKGIWVEDDAYVPKTGDIVIYDWQDNGKGDNKGVPDHVGVVEAVQGNAMSVIEGNRPVGYVARHALTVDGRYIRGYICPDYASAADPEPATPTAKTAWVQMPVLRKGATGGYVKTLQILLNKYAKAGLAEDGVFGSKTLVAVKAYQKSRKLSADGVVGGLTWAQILK